ncbi:MAG TPA: glycoside hydrolase family 44 protein [Candidatus Acidoferrales bacterium]|nr:glycoside hydrolase family 44 protein [Candidatus Acidoferrales bacterium]
MHRLWFRLAFYVSATVLLVVAVGQNSAAQTTPTLTVDAAGSPHAINPDIYGIANYGLDAGYAKEIQVPNIRWGGDATTRYNWQVDSSNAGFDWYFMGGNGQATPVPSASADLMINTYKSASNAHTLLTIPIIPYVNKMAAWNCSFPVSVYGSQQSTNPFVHPNNDNCGNSIATDGTQLMDNNIFANHIDNTVALQQGWMQHLITTFGTAANGGVPYYQLDNEPGGWSNTHRDVEPTQPDYDTIISLGQQYASMVKQTDPSAKVFGPVDFTLGGWIGTPSKQNNLFAGQYYLQKMAAYDQANSQRILDYFDEHYYGGGSTDAAQLASTRALWDPTFNSGSWVEQFYFDGPMQLIPRFQNWIQTYYPGTKLSISEYSFSGGTNPLVDALTEADVLGIYGRESLDFANFWTVPKPTDAVAYSFRLYRNYDGAGGKFGDTSVNSTSTDQAQLSVYGALRSIDGALTVVAINKTTSAIETSLALANFNSTGSAAVYTYSNANLTQIVAGTPVSVASNAVSYTFPAYSATVFVFTPASSSPVPAATKASLTAAPAQITFGQTVTFTASIALVSGSGVPTGSVTFKDGATQIGTGTLNSSGAATFTTSSLAVGSHSVAAVYAGNASFSASTSAAVPFTVAAAAKTATATSLSASATQLTSGQNVTFTAGVAPQSGNGTPTGTVAFLDGSSQIGSAMLAAGSASFSSANLSVGAHTIAAAYSGDSNYAASTSATVTVTVAAPPAADYSLTMSNSSLTVAKGASGTLTITLTPKNGFKQAVGLACSGLPTGATCSFNPPSLTPAGSPVATTLTVQAASAAATDVPTRGSFPRPGNMALYLWALALAGIFGLARKQPAVVSAKFKRAFLASAVVAVLLVTASCAGLQPKSSAAQPATFMVTVTASAANATTHTQQFTLTVMP